MRATALLTMAVALTGCASLSQAPLNGIYEGELCVATGSGASNCGAAEVWLFNGNVQVQVSDMVYRLALNEGWLDLMLVHGQTPVDGFRAPYQWAGHVLRFTDLDRAVHYRIRFADLARQPE